MCTECRSWFHYLCESIPPKTYFGDDAVYECLGCKSFIPETLEGYFVAKVQDNEDNLNLRLKYLPKEVIVRHKKTSLRPILVTLSANYWTLWIALILFARLIMGMSLLAITVKLF